jgi:hypothetical protein
VLLKHGRQNAPARTRRNPLRPDCSCACTAGTPAQPPAGPPLPFCFHITSPQPACAWSVAFYAHSPAESSRAGHRQNTPARTCRRASPILPGPPDPATPPSSPSAAMPSACRQAAAKPASAALLLPCACFCCMHVRSLLHLLARGSCTPAQLLLLLPDPRSPRPCRAAGLSAAAHAKLPPCAASLPSVRVRPELSRCSTSPPTRGRLLTPSPASRPACRSRQPRAAAPPRAPAPRPAPAPAPVPRRVALRRSFSARAPPCRELHSGATCAGGHGEGDPRRRRPSPAAPVPRSPRKRRRLWGKGTPGRGRTEREEKQRRRNRTSQGLMRKFRKLQGPLGKVKFLINQKP